MPRSHPGTGGAAPAVPVASVATTAAPPRAGAAVPVREAEPDVLTDDELDPRWDVLVWDDPVNLMSYVVHVFQKVLGVTEAVANRLMLEVHNEGRSLVATEPREKAERYVRQLHEHGLQATMRRAG